MVRAFERRKLFKNYRMAKDTKLKIGCHVSAAGGVFNAPGNAKALGCETFQIFTRPPMGGNAPELTDEIVEKFKFEMEKYYFTTPSASRPPLLKGGGEASAFAKASADKPRLSASSAKGRSLSSFSKEEYRPQGGEVVFVVHCPYFVNFGSKQPRIYYGSISVVAEELKRANLLGAKYVMTHLGSGKDLGQKAAVKKAKDGLVEVLKKYRGQTQFLLEIAAGAGETLGGTFEQLAELMEPLIKFKTFGGICFDTQHAFASGYDLRDESSVRETFKAFDKVIGLKWLKMSHINDSKTELGGRIDRHEHIGDGKIGKKGIAALIRYFNNLSRPSVALGAPSPLLGEGNNVAFGSLLLILETEHDKVKKDIKILKSVRDISASHSSPSDARPSELRTGGKLRNKN
jgi:deoxyribonuclease-4